MPTSVENRMSENDNIKSIMDLRIGDVVELLPNNPKEPFQECTVVQVTDSLVRMVRLYTSLADFETTAGVIAFIGREEITVPRYTPYRWYLLKGNIYRERTAPVEELEDKVETLNAPQLVQLVEKLASLAGATEQQHLDNKDEWQAYIWSNARDCLTEAARHMGKRQGD